MGESQTTPAMGARLPDSAAAWRSADFPNVLKRELEALPGGLPLGFSRGSAFTGAMEVMVLKVEEEAGLVRVKLGVFANEIVAGCSCGFEAEAEPCYSELVLELDAATGEARFLEA